MISITEGTDMENTSTGHRRWLAGLIISLFGAACSILYATYATGQQTKQIEINTKNIETLQSSERQTATKDDIKRLEDKIDWLMKREADRPKR